MTRLLSPTLLQVTGNTTNVLPPPPPPLPPPSPPLPPPLTPLSEPHPDDVVRKRRTVVGKRIKNVWM